MLNNLNFKKLKSIKLIDNTTWNYSYFPIIFDNEEALLSVQNVLNQNKIFPRRYFYPSLNKLPFVGTLVSDMQEQPMREVLKQFPKETFQLIIKIANEELKNK